MCQHVRNHHQVQWSSTGLQSQHSGEWQPGNNIVLKIKQKVPQQSSKWKILWSHSSQSNQQEKVCNLADNASYNPPKEPTILPQTGPSGTISFPFKRIQEKDFLEKSCLAVNRCANCLNNTCKMSSPQRQELATATTAQMMYNQHLTSVTEQLFPIRLLDFWELTLILIISCQTLLGATLPERN